MGQNQSRFESESPELRRIQEIAKEHGPGAVKIYLDEILNKWKNEPVKFGIIGKTVTGKSMFINAIRRLQEGDVGFAEVGRGNTTREPTNYSHPDNDQIRFVDLPGFGTTVFPKEEYIERMKICDYDYLFIFFDTVLYEDDIWAMRQLLKLQKSFSLVRSKIDKDIKAGQKRGENKESIITRFRDKILSDLIRYQMLEHYHVDIFFISGKKPEVGEMADLNKHILYTLSLINEQKYNSVVFTFFPVSKHVIEEKYKSLKKRVIFVTVGTGFVSAIPTPFLDIAINMWILVTEIKHYIKVFGLTRKQLELLPNLDYGRLKCRGILSASLSLTEISTIVGKQLGQFVASFTLVAGESVAVLLMALVGSVILSATTATLVYEFLNGYLDDLRHDAIVVYEHIASTQN